jgi:myo-inositol-1(or 4)-monophosphatase
MSASDASQGIEHNAAARTSHGRADARALLATCVAAAARGADVVRKGAERRASLVWETKGFNDFVSEIDRASEATIAEIVAGRHPDATLVAEEGSPNLSRSHGLVFVADPLDGTTNFLHDFPSYAVSVAGAVDGRLEVASIVNVATGDTYTASRGGGAWQGERRLVVSAIQDPAFALIGTGFPFKDTSRIEEYLEQFRRIAGQTSGIRRPGAAALDLADVAAGRFDGFWEQHLSAWDIAAGILLIREADGVVTDFSGRDVGVEHTGLVAGNTVIHPWLLETLGFGK